MYTLDIKYFKWQTIIYAFVSIVCLVFCLVYEYFSFGVYSKYMFLAPLIPLVFGTFVTYIIYRLKLSRFFDRVFVNLYNASVATFTLYFILKGVLEIYGTTNVLITVYSILGSVLGILSVLQFTRRVVQKSLE